MSVKITNYLITRAGRHQVEVSAPIFVSHLKCKISAHASGEMSPRSFKAQKLVLCFACRCF